MTIKIKLIFSLAASFFFVFQGISFAKGARIVIAPIEVQSGQPFDVPVMVEPLENIAGIKLVLTYDSTLITYVKIEKSEKTSQMMQVVNDQNPGRLIVVMASAKGISGDQENILIIQFRAAAGIKEKITTKIQITGIELVSEQLKTIPCKLTEGVITLLPEIN